MKMHIRNLFLLPVLAACFLLIPSSQAKAQTFTSLHSLADAEGVKLSTALVASGNTLYGTADGGGSWGFGTVFAVNTDGTGFTVLYSFTSAGEVDIPNFALIQSGNTLYGKRAGDIFRINTDGTDFTNLHSFTASSTNSSGVYTNGDGFIPSGLTLSGDTLYGTAAEGGTSGNGTVFKLNTDGAGFTTLYNFTATPPGFPDINADGAGPLGRLILSGNTLYGTASGGGTSGTGTVFRMNTDGTGFTTLHSFAVDDPLTFANADGVSPYAGLVLSGSTLYGTATLGGHAGWGTVFKVNTDGTKFAVLHHFTDSKSEGNQPYGGVIVSGNTVHGTTLYGGSSGNGTLYAINTDGIGFTNVHNFTPTSGVRLSNSDGAWPTAGLMLSDNTLYGATQGGGSWGNGTVFSLSLPAVPPQLTLIPSGPNVILSWPTDATGFLLQSTTTLGLSAVWTTNSLAPVVVNGQNTVTNPISGAQQFFRLSQ